MGSVSPAGGNLVSMPSWGAFAAIASSLGTGCLSDSPTDSLISFLWGSPTEPCGRKTCSLRAALFPAFPTVHLITSTLILSSAGSLAGWTGAAHWGLVS